MSHTSSLFPLNAGSTVSKEGAKKMSASATDAPKDDTGSRDFLDYLKEIGLERPMGDDEKKLIHDLQSKTDDRAVLESLVSELSKELKKSVDPSTKLAPAGKCFVEIWLPIARGFALCLCETSISF